MSSSSLSWGVLGVTGSAATKGFGGSSDSSPSTASESPQKSMLDSEQRQQHQEANAQFLPNIPSSKGGEVFLRASFLGSSSRKSSGRGSEKDQRSQLRIPRIDNGRGGMRQQVALCKQWIELHCEEQTRAQALVKAAQELSYDTMVRCDSAIVEDGYEQMHLLARKTAVSCFLLDEIVKALPRHEILRRCVGFLLGAVYVSDTQEMRDVLGGTVEYPRLLEDCSLDPTTRALLAQYARKTYFIAHHELTQKLIAHAHFNASHLQHFKRLPRVFALMNKNWIKSFLRNVLKAWQHMCRMRRQTEQKHRARWARRLAAGLIRAGVRHWRVYANLRLQGAAAAESMKTLIEGLKQSVQGLENGIQVLLEESTRLSAEIEAKGDLHVEFEKRIAEMEQEYKGKLEHVRQMDQVGSCLLDSLLLKTPFPATSEMLSPLEVLVLWANTTLLESPLGSLFLSTTEGDFANSIDNVMTGQQWHQVKVSDVSEDDLPFTPLLAETLTVNLPMHRFLALIRAMDFDAGPSKEDLKKVCTLDMRLRSLRSRMETQHESVDLADPETTAVLESETIVGRTLVDAYTALTGTDCIVTGDQLMTRRRGIQLVFLAGLMRYFSNWMENQVRKQRSTDESQQTFATTQSPSSTNVNVAGDAGKEKREASTSENHLGVRDKKYSEWYHPPQNHLGWMARVESQRRWIAASLSALHEALNLAVETYTLIPTEVQEDTPDFMENVNLKRLSDILPKEAIASSAFFLRLARVVENALPKLRALFLQYARVDRAADGRTIGPRYINFIDFWRLLCDCRVIGGPGKLHRAVVRHIAGNVYGSNEEAAGGKHSSGGGAPTMSQRKGRSVLLSSDIDVRGSYYRLRFGASGFMEMLLRCAQAWDNLKHRQMEKKLESSQRRILTAKVGAMTPATEASLMVIEEAVIDSDAGEAVEEAKEIHYDTYDMTWALRPAAVRDFFHEWIIPHGFRGPTLDPFRRAMRHPKLRDHIMANFDILFGFFTAYSSPKEACGLPVRLPDMETSMRRLLQDRSTTTLHLSKTGTTGNLSAYIPSNNVGIVRVMTVKAVQRIAEDFDWLRIRRVTPSVIERVFIAVNADTEHEPDVIFYPEWLDLLCVMAQYYDPDPTRPLHEKVPPFLEEYVLRYYRNTY
ncbi:hypothetical protein TraAM80_05637 [Trypanosoma rangeli]|uniref:Uncharacterized protein n=1 Tax=Trypanosoma rangeli TaxID=5698 RepID=A0A422NDF9_TRYRA|nr:uncharacterized protein TraAM80_05637 [Trypanosoma rangeli]RNF03476.1 hypothetical protein TraAM80_05637 [Trypanosoma rangeli]|eukprot:RNF03476.1 hypothetical protein TraAM80_05637 [Trypanosoma rangeli]